LVGPGQPHRRIPPRERLLEIAVPLDQGALREHEQRRAILGHEVADRDALDVRLNPGAQALPELVQRTDLVPDDAGAFVVLWGGQGRCPPVAAIPVTGEPKPRWSQGERSRPWSRSARTR